MGSSIRIYVKPQWEKQCSPLQFKSKAILLSIADSYVILQMVHVLPGSGREGNLNHELPCDHIPGTAHYVLGVQLRPIRSSLATSVSIHREIKIVQPRIEPKKYQWHKQGGYVDGPSLPDTPYWFTSEPL